MNEMQYQLFLASILIFFLIIIFEICWRSFDYGSARIIGWLDTVFMAADNPAASRNARWFIHLVMLFFALHFAFILGAAFALSYPFSISISISITILFILTGLFCLVCGIRLAFRLVRFLL